jgi:hypothetical protein
MLKAVKSWSLERLLDEAKRIHGEKYDYSKVKPDDCQSRKKLHLTCNKCSNDFFPALHDHIYKKTGCPKCNRGKGKCVQKKQEKWTLTRFLLEAALIHGDKYSYTNIKPQDCDRGYKRIEIMCKSCETPWTTSPFNHITLKCGCPNCLHWTLNDFLAKAMEIHGEKYDYSRVTKKHVSRVSNEFPLQCFDCGHQWFTTITNHIRQKSGCKSCAGKEPWTYERFMKSDANRSDLFDYCNILPNDIQTLQSLIILICKRCGHNWTTTLALHLKYGCPSCSKNLPWTFDRFLQAAQELNENRFSYIKVKPSDVQSGNSYVPVICNRCNFEWEVKIHSHLSRRSGCPKCRCSRGELACMMMFEVNGIPFQHQMKNPDLPRLRYDFVFTVDDLHILLEYDGEQHFKNVGFFHDRHEDDGFMDNFERDRLKTKWVLNQDLFRLIRIDYINFAKIFHHIQTAVAQFQGNKEIKVYYSSSAYDMLRKALLVCE